MNLYWYWPFARQEELGLADAMLRPGDRLLIQSLAGPSAIVRAEDVRYEVAATLPNVSSARDGSLRWVASRSRTYVDRVRQRRRTIRSGGFDLCHVLFLNRFTDLVDLGWLRDRLPVVCTVNDVFPHRMRLSNRLEKLVLGGLYRRAGAIVVYHEWLRGSLVTDFGVPAESVSVIPYPVPDVGRPRSANRALEERMVLFFGTFRPNKGIPLLLEAIRLLVSERDLRFHFAGRGDSLEEARVRAAAESDSRVVADIGWKTTEEKCRLFQRASLVVLPYTSFSSQSGVLHEAYAHRVPVIVSDVGAMGATVRDDRTGWVVPPSNAGALASTIEGVFSSGAAYSEAFASIRAVASDRSPVAVGTRLRELYDDVAHHG